MKTKNKIVVLAEIAIVLCSMFLVAIPAIAAEQNQAVQKVSATVVTTASEDDSVLGIYGNANEDDTIDMGDVVYTKLAIFGKKSKTELCDAKYDGRINVLDVIQTKLIILGKEKELTLIDVADRIVTVKKPLKRVVLNFPKQLETLRSLKVQKDIIVGVAKTSPPYDLPFFPEIGDIPSVGNRWNPDTEAILSLHPDAVFLMPGSRLNPTADVLESADIMVLRFSCGQFFTGTEYTENYYETVKKFGYIFGKPDEAEELIAFYEKCLNPIKEKVEKIPEEDKTKVYIGIEGYKPYYSGSGILVTEAGGKDIFPDISGLVDPEALIDRDPDIIVAVAYPGGGYDMDAGDTTELEELRNEIMNRPELANVNAVKNGKVYVITVHLYTGLPFNGCREFIAIAYMAKWFYPELFEDLDPKANHQKYLTRFQGLDIDLDEKGVFVYPEPS